MIRKIPIVPSFSVLEMDFLTFPYQLLSLTSSTGHLFNVILFITTLVYYLFPFSFLKMCPLGPKLFLK